MVQSNLLIISKMNYRLDVGLHLFHIKLHLYWIFIELFLHFYCIKIASDRYRYHPPWDP